MRTFFGPNYGTIKFLILLCNVHIDLEMGVTYQNYIYLGMRDAVIILKLAVV